MNLIYITTGSRGYFFKALFMLSKVLSKKYPNTMVVFQGLTNKSLHTQRKNLKLIAFIDNHLHQKLVKTSKLVIAHSGFGTVIDLLNANSFLLHARTKSKGSHVNNHQEQLKRYIADKKINKVSVKKNIVIQMKQFQKILNEY